MSYTHYHRFAFLLVLLCCTGCVSRLVKIPINPTPAQTEEHINELATNTGTAQSNSTPNDGTQSTASTSDTIGTTAFVDSYSLFRTALREVTKEDNWKKPESIKRYLDTGMTVADAYCRRHFNKLAEKQADYKAQRDAFSAIDAVTAAALGLAGAASETLAGAGVGFGLVDSAYENVDNNFFLSPDVANTHELVLAAQAKLATEFLGEKVPLTYPQAERALSSYAHQCSFVGIKQLLNKATADGKKNVQTDSSASELKEGAVNMHIKAIADEISIKPEDLTKEKLAALHSYHVDKITDGKYFSKENYKFVTSEQSKSKSAIIKPLLENIQRHEDIVTVARDQRVTAEKANGAPLTTAETPTENAAQKLVGKNQTESAEPAAEALTSAAQARTEINKDNTEGAITKAKAANKSAEQTVKNLSDASTTTVTKANEHIENAGKTLDKAEEELSKGNDSQAKKLVEKATEETTNVVYTLANDAPIKSETPLYDDAAPSRPVEINTVDIESPRE